MIRNDKKAGTTTQVFEAGEPPVAKVDHPNQMELPLDFADNYVGTDGSAVADDGESIFSELGERIANGLHKVADPFLISAIINTTGTAVCHFALGMPVDPAAVATFQIVGTTVGMSYGPIKDMIQDKLNPESDADEPTADN